MILAVAILAVGAGTGYHQYQIREEARIQKEEARKREEELQHQRKQRTKEAQAVLDRLRQASSDERLCEDMQSVWTAANLAILEIQEFQEKYREDEEELIADANGILKEAKERADSLLRMRNIEEKIQVLYDRENGTVAMDTGKNSQIFRKVQQELWKIPKDYPKKRAEYDQVIERISKEWNYVNDDWNYETGTLKISVEPVETDYTHYWICHVQTFSTDQLCSALCGGTYGNPRRTVSQELADHNGVLGINGSGFSYSSGIPAPGKSMIKDRTVYEDVYSNGNIMCVTGEGGMFTAPAGMTVQEMLQRDVKDTYCFGPTLVENGEAFEISEQFQQTYRYQRTAVGMISPGDYYLVIVDGKGVGGSQGMTYEELQQVFLDLDCEYAYNLDGGGSTTWVFKGRVINSLTDGKERPCGDILYFIDVGDGAEGDEIVIHEDEAMIRPPKRNS